VQRVDVRAHRERALLRARRGVEPAGLGLAPRADAGLRA
jgi:hypothetical protein